MKKSKIGVVMHEFKTGKLKSSSGQKVTNPKQGIAIALSEARRAKEGGEMDSKSKESKKMNAGGKALLKIKIPINRPTSLRRIPMSDKMAEMVPGQPSMKGAKAYKEGGVVRASKMGKVVSGGNKPHGEHTIQKKGHTQAAQIKMTGSKKMKSGGRII